MTHKVMGTKTLDIGGEHKSSGDSGVEHKSGGCVEQKNGGSSSGVHSIGNGKMNGSGSEERKSERNKYDKLQIFK